MRRAIGAHWGIGGGLFGRSRAFTSYTDRVELPGYVRADAMVYYQQGSYRLQLNLENLFDRRYYATGTGDNQITPGAPLSAMLRLSIDL